MQRLPKETRQSQYICLLAELSTSDKGTPVKVPIESNKYFEGIAGIHKNFYQVNLDEYNNISVSFIKDVPDRKKTYMPLTNTICIDIALVTAMATDRGDLFGRDFMERLLYYDNRISPLAANRPRQGLPVRSPRYDNRVYEMRQYLKNEFNRLLNRIQRYTIRRKSLLRSLISGTSSCQRE